MKKVKNDAPIIIPGRKEFCDAVRMSLETGVSMMTNNS
jgi:hypothetical protein